jgi:hypothetical protein
MKHLIDASWVIHKMVIEDPVGYIARKLPDGKLTRMTCGMKKSRAGLPIE